MADCVNRRLLPPDAVTEIDPFHVAALCNGLEIILREFGEVFGHGNHRITINLF
jgi:hypothetical protein